MKQYKIDEIIQGKHRLPLEEQLRLDLKPEAIPPLPKGEQALKPTTKAGWPTEAVKRAILNNLHNGSDWETLYIYGGSGRVARNWKALYRTLELLETLEPNETLFLQSGVPYGKTLTHEWAPRVVITNSLIVPKWVDSFNEFVKAGLTVYGQMTAGSFIFIGLQGIIQGTYETVAEAIRQAEGRNPNLSEFEKQLVVTAGLGLMSGAQPLAIKMAGKIAIVAEVNEKQIERIYNLGRERGTPYLDYKVKTPEEALKVAKEFAEKNEPISIGVHCNATELLQYLVDHNVTPLVLTDQTSAHDMLYGYFPDSLSYQEALELRETDPEKYTKLSYETVKKHVELMLKLQQRGSETFDYGNNIRTQAFKAGVQDAYNFEGFVIKYIRNLFAVGKGPFRWVALSNDPEDIKTTDHYAKMLFNEDKQLVNWIELADKYIPFETGLPARVFWAGFWGRAAFGMLINKLVNEGKIKAPIIIGRDHLDGGSVASPFRETEGMKDGSDAISDYPVLNLMGNALSGATWVSLHGGGGVGVGYSIHAGQVILADGTPLSQEKLFRVLFWDPLSAVLRHDAAGYEKAKQLVSEFQIPTGDNNLTAFNYKEFYAKTIQWVKEKTGIELFPPMEKHTMKLL